MSARTDLKAFPVHRTDEEAETFVETADLTEYDLSAFRPMRFEFEKKSAQVNMRIPVSLLDAAKAKATEKGLPFTRYIRLLLEEDVARGS